MIKKTCIHCQTDFNVPNCRASAKFCSRKCSDQHPKSENNAKCDHCGCDFHIKPSQLSRYTRAVGIFCSTKCLSEGKRKAYEGSGNPNYKGKNTDSNGYRLQPPSTRRSLHHTMKRVHQAVACETLGLERIPAGFHVHHRDCDILNNAPENLAILNVSDHKWLHKQFGVAALWAFCRGKIEMKNMIEWSDDVKRAGTLLPLSLVIGQQQYFGAQGVGGFGSTGA